MLHICLGLLHLPPALHPFILADVPCKHLPPPFLQHVGEWQRGHDGECLFQQEVDLGFCKAHKKVYVIESAKDRKLPVSVSNFRS